MTDILRFFLREPAIAGILSICLAIVIALIVSDRAEKRRMRELLRAKEAARAAKNGGAVPSATVPGGAFKFFRWEFVALSLVAAAFVIPRFNSPEVDAKAPAASESADTDADSLAGLEFKHTSSLLPGDAAVARQGEQQEELTNEPVDDVVGPADPAALFSLQSEAEWDDLGHGPSGAQSAQGFSSGPKPVSFTRP